MQVILWWGFGGRRSSIRGNRDAVQEVSICYSNWMYDEMYRMRIYSLSPFIKCSDNARATGGGLLDVVHELVLLILGPVADAELDDETGLTLGDVLEHARRPLAVSERGTVVDGAASGGLQVKEPDNSARLTPPRSSTMEASMVSWSIAWAPSGAIRMTSSTEKGP